MMERREMRTQPNICDKELYGRLKRLAVFKTRDHELYWTLIREGEAWCKVNRPTWSEYDTTENVVETANALMFPTEQEIVIRQRLKDSKINVLTKKNNEMIAGNLGRKGWLSNKLWTFGDTRWGKK